MSRAISGGAFGVLAIAVSALLIGSVAKPDPAPEQAVQAVVKQALNDIYDAATFKFPDWKRGPLDPSRVAEMHRGLDERLSKSMTGRAYLSYATTLHQTIDTSSSGENVVVTAGGVDQVDFHSVILDGNRGLPSRGVLTHG